jgi:hypothetical protein
LALLIPCRSALPPAFSCVVQAYPESQTLEITGLNVSDGNLRGFPHGDPTRFMFRLSEFDQPQAVAQQLAGVKFGDRHVCHNAKSDNQGRQAQTYGAAYESMLLRIRHPPFGPE